MRLSIFLLVMMTLVASCKNSDNQIPATLGGKSSACSSGAVDASSGETLFHYGDKAVTKAELPAALVQQIYENEVEAYNKNMELIKSHALALHLSGPGKELKDLSALITLPKLSDKEIKKFYEENKGRMPPNITLDQVKDQIVQYLNNQNFMKIYAEKMAQFEKSGKFHPMLVAPRSPEFKLDTTSFPKVGESSSKVKVIAISDYLCGHCQASFPTVKKVTESMKDKIEFVQVNFALRPQGLSGAYARGGYCAQKQNLFWKYHDETFKVTSVPHDHSAHAHDPAENDGKSPEAIAKVLGAAKISGVELKSFETCLMSKEAFDWVDSVSKMMNENGVSGTPTYIVNGKRVMKGSAELEDAIKKEL